MKITSKKIEKITDFFLFVIIFYPLMTVITIITKFFERNNYHFIEKTLQHTLGSFLSFLLLIFLSKIISIFFDVSDNKKYCLVISLLFFVVILLIEVTAAIQNTDFRYAYVGAYYFTILIFLFYIIPAVWSSFYLYKSLKKTE